MRTIIGLFTPATVAVLLGSAIATTGLYMVFPPAAFIIPGALLTAFGLWLALAPPSEPGP